MRVCTFLFFFCAFFIAGFSSPEAQAQTRYWVIFKDKPIQSTGPLVTESALQKRRQQHLPLAQPSDAPVHQPYLDSLSARGFTVSTISKWLNAAVVTAAPTQAKQLEKASFVQSLQPITGFFAPTQTRTPLNPKLLGKALNQLKPESLLAAGLTGRGVKVGVTDAGFYRAPQQPGLLPLFENQQVIAFRDFVNPAHSQTFDKRESLMDDHGTEVLLCLGGSDLKKQLRSGFSTGAEYYLARTDHGNREARVEEEHFVRALEWMDSLGVQLVNSSLGYGTGFDNPAENYRPEQMDGTSYIARAVQMAVEQKGMMLVIAAGNDGSTKKWQIINTPADAPGVLAVGATDLSIWTKQGYSSIGPSFLPYLKPDVACFASLGTSFSAPIIAGLAACLLEQNPALSPQQLAGIIKQSSHLYPFGNNYVGYGVPNAGKALELAKGVRAITPDLKPQLVQGSQFTFKPKPGTDTAGNGGIVLFRKKSETQVITQQKLSPRTRKIGIERLPGETHTTVQVGTTIMELVWQ